MSDRDRRSDRSGRRSGNTSGRLKSSGGSREMRSTGGQGKCILVGKASRVTKGTSSQESRRLKGHKETRKKR